MCLRSRVLVQPLSLFAPVPVRAGLNYPRSEAEWDLTLRETPLYPVPAFAPVLFIPKPKAEWYLIVRAPIAGRKR